MIQNELKYLVGSDKISNTPSLPFGDEECSFLIEVSKQLNSYKYISKYPDIKTMAFWCRKMNILSLKKKFEDKIYRTGIGLLFHITPSNVPINFFYSLIFGLLSGNSNIIKVPSKNFEQVEIICDAIKKVLKKNNLKNRIAIIQYQNNSNFTEKFSSICDGRIIWGGNKTINEIRRYPIGPRSIDLPFADRYSFAIINSKKVINSTRIQIKNLALNFYNDTYLVDQNACTSPHLILWIGNKKDINIAKKKFWSSLLKVVKKKYNFTNFAASEKINLLYNLIIDNENLKKIINYDNLIYTIPLRKIKKNNHLLRGKWGIFFESEMKNINGFINYINKDYQTLTYYGFEKNYFKKFLAVNKIRGIDRIVPIGRSMDISLFWDGYDLKNILTRAVEIS